MALFNGDDLSRLESALGEVWEERERQQAKWGEQNHEPEVFLSIITEEVGELAQAMLASRFGAEQHSSHSTDMRTEAVQAAACLVAFVEYLDRREDTVQPTSTPTGGQG